MPIITAQNNIVWALTHDNFTAVLNLLSIISTITSVWTFIIALNYRRKIISREEKILFIKNQTTIINTFSGFAKALETKKSMSMYLLCEIKNYINDIKIKYTFLSRALKKQLNKTYTYIDQDCLSNINNKDMSHKLCENINNIATLVGKEVVIT